METRLSNFLQIYLQPTIFTSLPHFLNNLLNLIFNIFIYATLIFAIPTKIIMTGPVELCIVTLLREKHGREEALYLLK